MPFDPSQPFEVLPSGKSPAVGFDPSQPFEVVSPPDDAAPADSAGREALADGMARGMAAASGLPAPIAKALLTRGGRVGDIAAEVVPAIGGTLVGTAVAPGAGTIAGGAAGAGLGNTLKQLREMVRGDRQDFGVGEALTSTVSGAIPVPGLKAGATVAGTVAKVAGARGLQGAAVAGGAEVGRQAIDEQQFDPAALATATGAGFALGAALGAGEGAVMARRLVRVATPSGPVEVPPESLPGALRRVHDETLPPPPAGDVPPVSGGVADPAQTVDVLNLSRPQTPAPATPPTGAAIADGPGVPAQPGAKPLGLVESAKGSPEIVPPLRAALEGYYNPQSNAASLAAATKQIDELGSLDAAKSAYLLTDNPDAIGNAMGLELVRKFQVENRLQDAADVLYDMSRKAKTQGQAIQILSTLSRGTPEGMAAWATRVVGRKLTAEELAEVNAGMARVAAAKEPEVKLARQADLLDAINSKVPASLAEKAVAAQNISLLLNPKTVIRNVLGNVLMASADLGADTLMPALDAGVGVWTGQRTVSGPALREYFSGLAQPARDARLGYQQARSEGAGRKQSIAEGLRTMATLAKLTSAGAMQITDVQRGYRTVFSSRLGKALERSLSVVLGVPDRAFYTARLGASLRNQMKAADVAVPTSDMVDRAALEAARAIYQDPNVISKRLGELKRVMNFGGERRWGLGQVVMPFTQVPGSLLLRGIEYSPAGFLKAAYRFVPERFYGQPGGFDQRAFVQDFTRALGGTAALTATGYWLSKLGVISSAPDADRDVEAVRRKLGTGGYRINASELKRRMISMDWETPSAPVPEVGDVMVSYDWAQPVAFPVALGADYAQSQQRNARAEAKGKATRTTSDVLNALISGARTIEEQPMLTGLSGFFTAAANAKAGDGAGATEALYNSMLRLPGVYLPTAVRSMQTFMDNRVYETRGTDAMESAYMQIAANVPKAAEALGYKPRYDVLGDLAERYSGGSNTAFNVFVNPAFVSRIKDDPETREVYRLWQQTGEGGALPRLVDRKVTINGQQKVLTAPEVADYQQMVGRVTRDGFRTLMRSERFQDLPDAARAEVMARVVTSANTAAKVLLFGHRPQRLDQFDQLLLGIGVVNEALPQPAGR